jgi:uncharacterized protein YwgA
VKDVLQVKVKKDILLLLIYSPGAFDVVNEPICGRTRLIKMLFLFKKEILPVFRKGLALEESEFYNFVSWNFGPFSTEVYDDLTFFLLRGFIEAKDSPEAASSEALAEWSEWLEQTGTGEEETAISEYTEECFYLTHKGEAFASRLYADLSKSQRALLREFKARIVSAPLFAILRYVYSRYPETTDKSEIRERVLGSGS